jgi:hypothetical protein
MDMCVRELAYMQQPCSTVDAHEMMHVVRMFQAASFT